MTAQQMWDMFSSEYYSQSEFTAWAFGEDPDELARLVNEGIKTATASAYPFYELDEEPLPQAGQYSIILNSLGEAVCIIRNTRVYITAFADVNERQAWKEGEGDRSLNYWRRVHERFFRQELQSAGLSFDEGLKIVCEEFEKVYP